MLGRYPDFLCIGAQKAGTTWLHANLRLHKKVWVPPIKEIHYFDQIYLPGSGKWAERLRERRADQVIKTQVKRAAQRTSDLAMVPRVQEIAGTKISDEWYGRIFAPAGADQVCGEITPEYSLLPPEGIEHVISLVPKARIILSMRDPISRSWSHIRMLASNRSVTDVEQMAKLAAYDGVVERSNYPAILERWREFVEPEQLLVISMDDIAEQPTALMRTLCDFLGVASADEDLPKLDKTVFKGKSMSIPDVILNRLKRKCRPIYDELGRDFPDLAHKWMQPYYP